MSSEKRPRTADSSTTSIPPLLARSPFFAFAFMAFRLLCAVCAVLRTVQALVGPLVDIPLSSSSSATTARGEEGGAEHRTPAAAKAADSTSAPVRANRPPEVVPPPVAPVPVVPPWTVWSGRGGGSRGGGHGRGGCRLATAGRGEAGPQAVEHPDSGGAVGGGGVAGRRRAVGGPGRPDSGGAVRWRRLHRVPDATEPASAVARPDAVGEVEPAEPPPSGRRRTGPPGRPSPGCRSGAARRLGAGCGDTAAVEAPAYAVPPEPDRPAAEPVVWAAAGAERWRRGRPPRPRWSRPSRRRRWRGWCRWWRRGWPRPRTRSCRCRRCWWSRTGRWPRPTARGGVRLDGLGAGRARPAVGVAVPPAPPVAVAEPETMMFTARPPPPPPVRPARCRPRRRPRCRRWRRWRPARGARSARASAWPPLLARAAAPASAVEPPVEPELPVAPEVRSPPARAVVPSRTGLVAVMFCETDEESPVAPDAPDPTAGLARATAVASPVSPELAARRRVVAPSSPTRPRARRLGGGAARPAVGLRWPPGARPGRGRGEAEGAVEGRPATRAAGAAAVPAQPAEHGAEGALSASPDGPEAPSPRAEAPLLAAARASEVAEAKTRCARVPVSPEVRSPAAAAAVPGPRVQGRRRARGPPAGAGRARAPEGATGLASADGDGVAGVARVDGSARGRWADGPPRWRRGWWCRRGAARPAVGAGGGDRRPPVAVSVPRRR